MKDESNTISPSLSAMIRVSLWGAWAAAGVSITCLKPHLSSFAPAAASAVSQPLSTAGASDSRLPNIPHSDKSKGALPHVILTATQGKGTPLIPILYVRKLRFREIK